MGDLFDSQTWVGMLSATVIGGVIVGIILAILAVITGLPKKAWHKFTQWSHKRKLEKISKRYFLKEDMLWSGSAENNTLDGPFCPNCKSAEGVPVRLRVIPFSKNELFDCPTCKLTYGHGLCSYKNVGR